MGLWGYCGAGTGIWDVLGWEWGYRVLWGKDGAVGCPGQGLWCILGRDGAVGSPGEAPGSEVPQGSRTGDVGCAEAGLRGAEGQG